MTRRWLVAWLLLVLVVTLTAAWWFVRNELRALDAQVKAARGVDTQTTVAAAIREEEPPVVRWMVVREACWRARRYWWIRTALVGVYARLRYSPDELLATFLNMISVRRGDGRALIGVDAAARFYFRKPARDLTQPEARWLAELIRYPMRRPKPAPQSPR